MLAKFPRHLAFRRRQCFVELRSFVRRQSSTPHPPLVVNSQHAPKFASFFWGNAMWPGIVELYPQRWRPTKNKDDNGSAATDFSSLSPLISAYPPSSTAVAYRPARPLSLPRLLSLYTQLSKTRLTILVVLTAMSSVALSPLPTSVPVLLSTALGTALCSASANALNQIQEIPFDAQMTRTRNRPLVRHAISPLHATAFAVVTGLVGPALLWTCVNPVTAILGTSNIALYAGAYTYLKRRSILNTWVGSVVGALPPLMGWTACGGHLLPSSTDLHLFLPSFLSAVQSPIPLEAIANPFAPLALFMFLFSWQFPHFNSLSHLVRSSYAQAGYHMLSVVNPPLNTLVSLRHALLLIPICSVLFPISGLTTWTFALTSLVPNIICTRYAWAFWRKGGEKEARKVWHGSLWYLPVVMGLMMVHKNGLDWTSWFGPNDKDSNKQRVNSQTAT